MATSPRRLLSRPSSNVPGPSNTPAPDLPLPRRAIVHGGTLLVLGTFLGSLAACKPSAPAPTSSGEVKGSSTTAGGKVFAIGTDASYPPFESQDEKGDFVGFDIELVQAAAKIGLEVEFINTPWEGLITALEQGDLDAAVSAIAITDERRKNLEFTTPYFEAQQLILVPAASKVKRLGDLKGLRVGVQLGSAGDDIVTTLLGSKHGAAIQRYESTPLALTEFEARNVDAVVSDNGVLAHYVLHNGGAQWRLVDDPAFEKEPYAIAVKKGQSELLAKLDAGLAAMRADGSYAALFRRYFGELSPPAAMGIAVAGPAVAGPATAAVASK